MVGTSGAMTWRRQKRTRKCVGDPGVLCRMFGVEDADYNGREGWPRRTSHSSGGGASAEQAGDMPKQGPTPIRPITASPRNLLRQKCLEGVVAYRTSACGSEQLLSLIHI